MRYAILNELTDIIVTIANLEKTKIGNEEKNFITGRLTTLSNILERYMVINND